MDASRIRLLFCIGSLIWVGTAMAQSPRKIQPPAYRQALGAVQTTAGGMLVCEAEEFNSADGDWQPRPWGTNYYAATFANTFLSRKGYLSAPPQCESAAATIEAFDM